MVSARKQSRTGLGKTTDKRRSRRPQSNSKKNITEATKKKRLIALIVVGFAVLLLIGAAFAYALFIGSLNQELSDGKTSEEQQAIADELAAPPNKYSDPFYMLLLGSDARADDPSMGKRSDTNILARIDASTGTVTLLSIPRDTKIEIDGYGTDKFNAAYSYGGVALAVKETSQLLDVDISHYAEIDFEKLIQLVDTIGGVEVDVPERINDPDAGDVIVPQGLQILDGEAALVFARSRDYPDGDFTRTSNQRLLIQAIVKKVLNLPLTEMPGAIQSAAKCVTTDLKAEAMLELAIQFRNATPLKMYSAIIPSTSAMIGGISYMLHDQANLPGLMKLIDEGKDPSSLVTLPPNYDYAPQNFSTDTTYTVPQTNQDTPVTPQGDDVEDFTIDDSETATDSQSDSTNNNTEEIPDDTSPHEDPSNDTEEQLVPEN